MVFPWLYPVFLGAGCECYMGAGAGAGYATTFGSVRHGIWVDAPLFRVYFLFAAPAAVDAPIYRVKIHFVAFDSGGVPVFETKFDFVAHLQPLTAHCNQNLSCEPPNLVTIPFYEIISRNIFKKTRKFHRISLCSCNKTKKNLLYRRFGKVLRNIYKFTR